MSEIIELLVDGGKATAGPPLGPTLAPMKLNVGKVVADINEKTKAFAGMKVPVKLIIDTTTKEYIIEIGLPPTSQLIKKEIKLEKGSQTAGKEIVGDLPIEKAIEIAKTKEEAMFSKDIKNSTKQVVGTCLSMGITVGGKDPREMIKEINEGKHDSAFQ